MYSKFDVLFSREAWRNVGLAGLILLALFAALNYQGHNYSYRWLVVSELVLAALIFAGLLGRYRLPLVLPANPVTISYALFLFWSGLSLLWSAAPSDSFLTLLAITPCLLGLLIGGQLDARRWRAIKLALLPLFAAVAGYSIYQSFWLNLARPVGFLLDWNSNAVFMAMLVLPFVADFLNDKGLAARVAVLLLLGAGGFAMALTQSRGALLVLLVAGLALAPRLVQGRQWRGAALFCAAVFLGFAIGDWINGGLMFARFSQPLAHPEAVTAASLASGRAALWAAGWQMYLDRPLLGWGLGTYHWLYPMYRDPQLVEGGQLAHNDYLETLLSVGPLGLILLLGFVLSALDLLRRLSRSADASGQALNATILVAISLGVLAHSAVNFNLYQPCILILLGLYLGYAGRVADSAAAVVVPAAKMTREGYFGIVGGGALLMSLAGGTLLTGMHYRELASDTQKQPAERLSYLESASRYLPFMEEYYALQAAVALDLLKAPTPAGGADEGLYQELVGHTLKMVDTGIARNPLRALSYRNRAELLAVQAHSEAEIAEVVAVYRQSLTLDPYDLETRISLCGFLIRYQKTQEAMQALLEGLDKSYYAEAKHGMQLLLSLHQLAPSAEDKAKINAMINELGPKLLNEQAQIFSLGKLAASAGTAG